MGSEQHQGGVFPQLVYPLPALAYNLLERLARIGCLLRRRL